MWNHHKNTNQENHFFEKKPISDYNYS
jgi:hypothetical protein